MDLDTLVEILVETTNIKSKNASELAIIILKYDEPANLVYEAIGMINNGVPFQKVKEDYTARQFFWKSTPFKKLVANREAKDTMLETPPEIREGEMECPKCHQKKTLVVEMQTRSADEGFTYYIHCLNPKCKAITK